VEEIQADTNGLFPENPENVSIDTEDLPYNAKNFIKIYGEGGKGYQKFDSIDPETGLPPRHTWDFPVFRGVNDKEALMKLVLKGGIVKSLKSTIYPHKLVLPGVKKNTWPVDYSKPAYRIVFNHDPEEVVRRVGDSYRISKNLSTGETLVDENGHALLTKDTWITPMVQETFLDLISQGVGYTVEVYTTEHHPFEMAKKPEDRTKGGLLVAGAVGVVIKGVVTGLTVFMDRTKVEGSNKHLFDGAGKAAFFAEFDYFESLGINWLDAVTVNPVSAEFGGRFILRTEFHKRLQEMHARGLEISVPRNKEWEIRFDRWSKENIAAELQAESQPKLQPEQQPVEVLLAQ
jgi:Leu/Phe-tRNA-protein transferase